MTIRIDISPFDTLYLGPYGMLPLFLVMGWLLTSRFVQALQRSEQLNIELEERVAQKHVELAENFKRLEQIQRQTAIVEERQRLMCDMHDGIGSQLISILDLLEHGQPLRTEIASELRECLDSLRLTIDSLEPVENDLLTVMGNLRYRLEGRLRRRGIALDWQACDVPELPALTPQNVLHILRILQEAFTNVLKHTCATTIKVQTGVAGEHVVIRVSDNGHGFTSNREGRGLASMRRRAQAMGATLELTPSAAGTTLSLYISQSPRGPRCGIDEVPG
jgi:signal transduction histidine kinase